MLDRILVLKPHGFIGCDHTREGTKITIFGLDLKPEGFPSQVSKCTLSR